MMSEGCCRCAMLDVQLLSVEHQRRLTQSGKNSLDKYLLLLYPVYTSSCVAFTYRGKIFKIYMIVNAMIAIYSVR